MKLTVYEDVSAFDALADEWNMLLRRSTTDMIFLTLEWQSTWWQVYQAGELWIVACRGDDDTLLGIAPWFIQHFQGERVVRTIGCVDVTDYVDIIADRQHVEAVQKTLADFLAQHHERYDRINLCNIPEDSPTYAQFAEHLRRHRFDADLVLQEVCPVIHLPNDWEDYLEGLDKKQRHELRRKIRRAEGEAEIGWYIVGSDHVFDDELERFLKLMAASQPAKAEFLSDPHNAQFLRDILRTMHARGWLKLSFLTVNSQTVATYCDFDYGDRVLVYNSGLLPGTYSHLSTGIVLLCYNIRHAIETGHKVFDFLRGNEVYKYRMGAQDTRVFKLRATLKGEVSTAED